MKRFFLGAPWLDIDRTPYREALKRRFFVSTSSRPEEAVGYIHRIVDRQINKARGLLTYNALLFAAFRFGVDSSHPGPQHAGRNALLLLGGVSSLVACIPLLVLFWVSWMPAEHYDAPEQYFEGVLEHAWRRTHLVAVSLYTSALTTLLALMTLLWR